MSESKQQGPSLLAVAALFGGFAVLIAGLLVGGLVLMTSRGQNPLPDPSKLVSEQNVNQLGGTAIEIVDKGKDRFAEKVLQDIDRNPMTDEQEVDLGDRLWKESGYAEAPEADSKTTARVKAAFRRLFEAGVPYRFKAFRVRVIEAPKIVNALTMPGGNFVVYTGLLDAIGDDEEQLLFTIGHEIGHAQLHTARMAKLIRFAQREGGSVQMMLLAQARNALSQEGEFDADAFACAAVSKLGIGKESGIRLIDTLARATGTAEAVPTEAEEVRTDGVSSVVDALYDAYDKHFTSHPDHERRKQRIRDWNP